MLICECTADTVLLACLKTYNLMESGIIKTRESGIRSFFKPQHALNETKISTKQKKFYVVVAGLLRNTKGNPVAIYVQWLIPLTSRLDKTLFTANFTLIKTCIYLSW